MENWQYHATYSGCPQGGIVSPILSNIYLNELDKFAEGTANEFYSPVRRTEYTEDYRKLCNTQINLKKRLKKATGQEKSNLLRQLKVTQRQIRQTPSKAKTDKVLKYIRYADDFIIGVKGTKADCEKIKRQFSEFISQTLKMELSEEKALITHSNQHARFLGYDVRVRRDNHARTVNGHTKRTMNYSVELNVPFADKIMPFLFEKSVAEQTKSGEIEYTSRKRLTRCTDFEIVSTYNSELRGICNYYGLASNYLKLNYFAYLMEYSCLKTLAHKHKSTSNKIIGKYRDGKGWSIPYPTAKGEKRLKFAKFMECKNTDRFNDVIVDAALIHSRTATSFEERLTAKVCELCGKTDTPIEIHHVNKVKNLKGKTHWEIVMIAKRRKTLAVCEDCHYKIHNP
jgi:hypothetical protein